MNDMAGPLPNDEVDTTSAITADHSGRVRLLAQDTNHEMYHPLTWRRARFVRYATVLLIIETF